MTNVVTFTPRPLRKARVNPLPAAVVIFPGVRYERTRERAPDAKPSPREPGKPPGAGASR